MYVVVFAQWSVVSGATLPGMEPYSPRILDDPEEGDLGLVHGGGAVATAAGQEHHKTVMDPYSPRILDDPEESDQPSRDSRSRWSYGNIQGMWRVRPQVPHPQFLGP